VKVGTPGAVEVCSHVNWSPLRKLNASGSGEIEGNDSNPHAFTSPPVSLVRGQFVKLFYDFLIVGFDILPGKFVHSSFDLFACHKSYKNILLKRDCLDIR
jgi:hypothetical protein